MQEINRDHPLRRHFAGLVEHAFCEQVGLCDPQLTGYLADLLVEYTHIDRLNAMRNARGKELERTAKMLLVLTEDETPTGCERDRTLYRHIGDYVLFWAGIYPEQIQQQKMPGGDTLLDYVSQGKRSYAIVADLTGEGEQLPPSLFRHLSEDFEFCLYGLGLVRRGLQHTPPPSSERGGLIY